MSVVMVTKRAANYLKIFKTIRVPRKRKKQLKQRWDYLWTDFIKIKLKDE